MIIPHKALIYSSNPKIKINDLKTKKFKNIDISNTKKTMEKYKINAIIRDEDNYHYKLQLIKSPPYIIYYLGNLNLLNNEILGIVGPRIPSEYGKEITKLLLDRGQNYHITTISGLAAGIDTLCHALSIKYKIPTIAILGGGLHRFLKSNNKIKINKIIESGGLIISEFKLDQEPFQRTFPQRNRIIAGLSKTLFLPEAGKKSGSLITADFAYQTKIPIYGAPNSIFSPQSQGLFQYFFDKKIIPIANFKLFLDKYFTNKKINIYKKKEELSKNEKYIFSYFQNKKEITIIDLLKKSGHNLSELLIILSKLEIKRYITQLSPNTRTINNKK